jgi:hypothetical protein
MLKKCTFGNTCHRKSPKKLFNYLIIELNLLLHQIITMPTYFIKNHLPKRFAIGTSPFKHF